MRILYYSPHPHLYLEAPTGYGRHMREMINAWESQGHEVSKVIGGQKPKTSNKSQAASGRKSRLKKLIPSLIWESLKDFQLLKHDVRMAAGLKAAIADFQPDLVYERMAYLQTSGVNVAREMGVKHILEMNAPYPEERVAFSGKSVFLAKARKAEKKVWKATHGISVVSSALKSYILEKYPKASEKVAVIPNAISPTSFDQNGDDMRQKLGLNDELVIGFLGSIFPYHGVDTLIQAFSSFRDRTDLRLLIVGDGETLGAMKELCSALDITDKVIFTGAVPHANVGSYIRTMDICCMSRSNWYGSPVKIFEYGLFEKAVLAPDVIPVRDVMSETDGILVDDSIQSTIKGLQRLVESEELRKWVASNWHQKVLANYTWDKAATKTLSLCE